MNDFTPHYEVVPDCPYYDDLSNCPDIDDTSDCVGCQYCIFVENEEQQKVIDEYADYVMGVVE